MKIGAAPSYIPALLRPALDPSTGTPVAMVSGDSSMALAVPITGSALGDPEALRTHLASYGNFLKVDRHGASLVTALAGGAGDMVKEFNPAFGTATSEAIDVVAIFSSGVGVIQALQDKDKSKGLWSAAQVGINALDLAALHAGSSTLHLVAFVLRTGAACVSAVSDHADETAKRRV
ncbi:MAG TPA: hypothetical protein VGV37_27840 [Aliidongia sp.]|uniref:hypothetical protein n=1 Tax=Aliidongia sp. TaxID=1914230 RepID=UPI002DDD1266|nr:hypothetical protein [Aliidongia sp.]HEV2678372.1 hypothetical protein [Aliidongia sp.]